MPELPEVENVRISLEQQGLKGQTFSEVVFLRPDLRTKLRPDLKKQLPGQSIQTMERRAKYLLWHTDDYTVISHLGMTGSWRFIDSQEQIEKHDHVVLRFRSGKTLVFNDPRRFGIFEFVPKPKIAESRWLQHLGPEPLSETFTAKFLFSQSRRRSAPIKAFLMDQRNVVGVGNIYASEALFKAGIRPTRQAGKITQTEAVRLVEAIQKILNQAIQSGGSTIRDYRNSQGESGKFQAQFAVYDRKGEPCQTCSTPIKAKVIAGRSTFWCNKCQR